MANKIKIIIVDDESLARQIIINLSTGQFDGNKKREW